MNVCAESGVGDLTVEEDPRAASRGHYSHGHGVLMLFGDRDN